MPPASPHLPFVAVSAAEPSPPRPALPPPAGLLEIAGALLQRDLDPSDLRNRDVAFVRTIAPILFSIGVRYFRAEAEGTEHFPESGQFIAVGNHSGAPLLPDVCVLGAWFALQGGYDRPTYMMVHDFPFRVPVVRNFLAKCGALPASRENAERVLRAGASMLCFPGGDVDCMRSFRHRNRIELEGHTGFIELAFTHGVPIVPFVNVGGHEVYVTLLSSRRLAQWTGLQWLTRVKSVPLIAGLPWGLWFTGFLPYVPLPAKFVYKVGPPIHLEHDPERARDRQAVRRVYRRVTAEMQAMLDDLARRRRFPILG